VDVIVLIETAVTIAISRVNGREALVQVEISVATLRLISR
jgi:hypothetical protein